jgi:hypothetical protein
MSEPQFSVSVAGMTSSQLSAALAEAAGPQGADGLGLRSSAHDTRTLDPTVVVAAIGLVGTVINVLFTMIQGRRRARVVVMTATGSRLEAPANISPEELDLFVDKVRRLDVAHIHVAGGDS